MKFSLKIMLCMLGLLSLLFGIGSSLIIHLSFQTSLEREQESAHNAYSMVLGTLQVVSNMNGKINDSEIAQTLAQLSGQNADSWTALRLYTADRALYEYNAGELARPTQPPPSGKCAIGYTPIGGGKHSLVLSGALETDGVTFYLDMTRDISPLFESRQAQQKIYQWVFLLLTVLCALLSYGIAHILTQPLSSLSKASQSIAAGQLSYRARISTGDEVGLVARDFNAMAESLETNIAALRDSMERQERFIASFAHEVKTPMTSIIGYADLLQGQTLDTDEQRHAAHYIVEEGKRLESLSQKLMDILVLKRDQVVLIQKRPADLIRGLCDHLEPLYTTRGIRLTCDCEVGVCCLEPTLVKSLLVNLLDNAQKAMDGKPGEIHICSNMLADGCRITVRDNGRGIPPTALEHLTEAFYRVDKSRSREQGGMGLGLSLCQEIVTLHKGNITFQSQLDVGTTVVVTLRGGGI